MKSTIFTIFILCLSFLTQNIFAQWTPSGNDIYFNSGNVGIGLTTPGSKLMLKDGDFRIEEGRLRIWNYGQSTDPAFRVYKHSNLTYPNQTAFEVVGGVVDVSPKSFKIYTANNDPWNLLGIMQGNFLMEEGNFEIFRYGDGGLTPAFKLKKHSNLTYPNQTAFEIIGGVTDVSPKKFRIYTDANDPWNLKCSFDGSLSVCGGIRTMEVKVETGWCDNVFEPNYNLLTIEAKEAYVKEHKHLPSVTSGAEIEKEGLEVGKTAKQMIQELEEAHLYIFELNSALKAQGELLKKQQEAILKLQEDVTKLKN